MDDTASRVILDEVIDNIGPVTCYDQPSHVVTDIKIVHCIIDFKGRTGSGSGTIPKTGTGFYGRNPSKII